MSAAFLYTGDKITCFGDIFLLLFFMQSGILKKRRWDLCPEICLSGLTIAMI